MIYLIGIDNVTREYYRVTANDEKQAYDYLADWAEGTLKEESLVQYESSNDSEYPVTSIGEAVEEKDDKKENILDREEQARYNVAVQLENTHGSSEFQCGPDSPVEFVDGGAWVTVRIFTDGVCEAAEPEQCPSKMGRHECCKPAGHVNDEDNKMHVSESPAANWETEEQDP